MINVTELFFFLDMGGVEKIIVDIANHLPSDQFKKTVIITHKTGLMKQQLNNNVRVIEVLQKYKMQKLVAILQEFDLCHIHINNCNPFFVWSASIANVPIIVNSIDSTVSFPYSAYVDYTVCVAEHILHLQSSPQTSGIIYNGTSVESTPRHRTRGEGKKIVLAEMRRPDKKMIASLIDLYPLLREKCQNIECWIIGVEGESQDGLKYMGKVPEPSELLCQADFLIHLPCHEALSNSVLEGMACGAIPIVSGVGGIVEIVNHEENGFILPNLQSEDILQIANNLHSIISDYKYNLKKYEKIRENTQNTVQQNFNKAKMLKNYQELFVKLVHKNQSLKARSLSALAANGSPNSDVLFLSLLENYCFNPVRGLQAIKTTDFSQLSEPQQAFLLGILGNECLKAGHAEAAKKLLQLANNLWDEDFYLSLYLGLAEKELGNVDAAILAFDRARELNPYDIEPGINLMECYLTTSDRDAAMQINKQLIRILPEGHTLKPTLQLLQSV